ncbi:hypothetical protein [Bradyrhizobium sp. RDM4]|uniref:hypothetical protein n=1 Tax=Bradyrhizobium sp. RDM4 TaxID=3378765 RepID=UPI0038FC1E63
MSGFTEDEDSRRVLQHKPCPGAQPASVSSSRKLKSDLGEEEVEAVMRASVRMRGATTSPAIV